MTSTSPPDRRPGTLVSLGRAMTSWRTASVALLSFSSGLPYGLVVTTIPDWLRSSGVDIRLVGLITMARAPWAFKVLWSPLMDRFTPPWLGRRRGWIALSLVALAAMSLCLAALGHTPGAPWVIGAIALALAFASATYDIAYDAYAVDVLRPEEQGIAVGARAAVYRGAWVAASGLITLAAVWTWPSVYILVAASFMPMLIVAWKAPEPPGVACGPKTLREALWLPFLGMLSRHRALEILAFVFFYKFADNLAVALLRPFLYDMGYSDVERGFGLGVVGLFATLIGTFVGGAMTTTLGLGHSLWLFGALQIASNIGYVVIARSGIDPPLMYAAAGFDTLTQGLGSGAFGVFLLRLTQKRFSATQYALFSSLFSLPGLIAGPVSGFAVDALGWEAFFWLTLLAGVPGLALLQRFAPVGMREPVFQIEAPPRERRPLPAGALVLRGGAGGAAGLLVALLCAATMGALKDMRAHPEIGFDLARQLRAIAGPSETSGWLLAAGIVLFGVFSGMFTAAVFAARHGDVDREVSAGAGEP